MMHMHSHGQAMQGCLPVDPTLASVASADPAPATTATSVPLTHLFQFSMAVVKDLFAPKTSNSDTRTLIIRLCIEKAGKTNPTTYHVMQNPTQA